MNEPLFKKDASSIAVVISVVGTMFLAIGWTVDKVIKVDERSLQAIAAQDRIRSRVTDFMQKALDVDEQVVRNTTTIELLHERLDRLEARASISKSVYAKKD